jgi:hypothetical protein
MGRGGARVRRTNALDQARVVLFYLNKYFKINNNNDAVIVKRTLTHIE